MFTIGDFARLGGVSIRMLRHYDAIGLLHPASVDPDSGYRFYRADQLARLNRVIALKDLGFTLDQVATMLDEEVGADELRGMLRLRRAELGAQLQADADRLTRIESRLRSIESEGRMPTTQEVTVKNVEPIRLAAMSGHAEGFAPEHITPVIHPMFGELGERMEAADVEPQSMPIAWYEADGDGVLLHAGLKVNGDAAEGGAVEIVELPSARVATLIHEGSMEECLPSYDALGRWIDENGLQSAGRSREVTLACGGGPENWVTELQIELA